MLNRYLKTVAAGFLALGFCASANAALVQTIRYANLINTTGIQNREIKAWCLANEVATGGGFRTFGQQNIRIDDSAPTFSGTAQGWTVRYNLVTSSPEPVIVGSVYVVCLREL